MIRMCEIEVEKARTCILKVDRLEIAPGRRLLVQGRNGAGKSTLLRVLAGLEQPSSGQLQGLPERRARVLVHQAPFVFRGNVIDNLVLGMKARHFTRAERQRRAEEYLEAFALTALATRSARSLSGGERRRLALARALILEPELLLLDEPLSDLDEAGQAALAAALEVRKRMTVVTASPVRMPDFLAEDIHVLQENVDAI